MQDTLNSGQPHAVEAIAVDAISLSTFFLAATQHPHAALLFHGIVPLASMFVVESYIALITMFPQLREIILKDHADLLKASRHRAKLLDDTIKSIDEVAGELVAIAKQQRTSFQAPHSGFLAPLKRAIQRDMGLSKYENHIFSTTHATVFGFGAGVDFASSAFSVGEAIGEYIGQLLTLLQIQTLPAISPSVLNGTVEMQDIKYEALYRRGVLGTIRMDYAAGLTLLLASLDLTHYVIRHFLPAGDLTLFRLKFIVAYHADSNLRIMQNVLTSESSITDSIQAILADCIGNNDSKWLRKRKALRNLLVHYLADKSLSVAIPQNATRLQAIECLSGNMSFTEMDALLDRHIAHLSSMLETGFSLAGNPFWYGKVS